jgi:hypothetical protein
MLALNEEGRRRKLVFWNATTFLLDLPPGPSAIEPFGKSHALSPAVPKIPVGDIGQAIDDYRDRLGLEIDWGGDAGGIAGTSRDDCRAFLTDGPFWSGRGNAAPVLVWLSLNLKKGGDELQEHWRQIQAKIVSASEPEPWVRCEFTADDLDGNLFRVFCDFATPERDKQEIHKPL